MNYTIDSYLERLTNEVPQLATIVKVCTQEWTPDKPPMTTLFAAIGDGISQELSGWSTNTRERVFAIVEIGMVNEDRLLQTAVATGLVEALVTNGDARPDLWIEYKKCFGPKTLQHAIAWRDFGRKDV